MKSETKKEILEVLSEAKLLPAAIAHSPASRSGFGEVAEFEASRTLGLELTEARRAGCDAIRKENGLSSLQVEGGIRRIGSISAPP